MNDFQECYDIAESGKCEPFWDEVYHRAFPNMTNHMRGQKTKCQSQIFGVDRIIYLENGKTITIDEKVRTKVRDDIALEYISNDQKNTPGWIEKDLAIDYLAYAFLPAKRAYLFDWRMLKRVWAKYGSDWKTKYFIAKAPNRFYTTYSVCVPIDVLQHSCTIATIIQL